MSIRKSWDPLDDFFDDNYTVESITNYAIKNVNNDDELDQDELLGIEINPENFDDDFGLSDGQTVKTDLEIESKKKEINSEQTKSFSKDENSTTLVFTEKIDTQIQDNFIDKEISKLTENQGYTNSKQKEIEYEDLLEYGEDDDCDLVTSRYNKEVAQKNVMSSNKDIQVLIKSKNIKITTVEPQIQSKQLEIDSTKKKIEEDFLENDEEENLETTKKQGRSNYWSERNIKNENEPDNKSNQRNNNMINRNNRFKKQIHHYNNRNNINSMQNNRSNCQQKGQNFKYNNINCNNYKNCFANNNDNSNMNSINSFNQNNLSNIHQNSMFQVHNLTHQSILPLPLPNQHNFQKNNLLHGSIPLTQTNSFMNMTQHMNPHMNLYTNNININSNMPDFNKLPLHNTQDIIMNHHQMGMINNNKLAEFQATEFQNKIKPSSDFIKNKIQGANLSHNQMKLNDNNKFNQNINHIESKSFVGHNGFASFQNLSTNSSDLLQNGLFPNQIKPQQNSYLPFNNNNVPINQDYHIELYVSQSKQKMPLVNSNILPLKPAAPVKPSHVYLNPSFISKKNISDGKKEKDLTENRQNVLKDSNTSPDSSSEKNTISISNNIKPKQRSKIDLNALLEKRLAEEMKGEIKTSHGTKRKSIENTSLSPNKQSKKYETKIHPSDMKSEPKITVKINSYKVYKSVEQPENKKQNQISKVIPVDKKLQKSEPKAKLVENSVVSETRNIIIDDPDYTKKLEAQKKKREEFLKLKEDRRRGKFSGKSSEAKETQFESALNSYKQNVIITRNANPKTKKSLHSKSPTLTNVKNFINKTLQGNYNEKTLNVIQN